MSPMNLSEWVSEWVGFNMSHQHMGHFGDESFQSITFAGTDTWQETEFEYLRTLLIHAMRVIVVLPDYQTDRDRQEHWSSKKSDVEVCDQWPHGVLGDACWTGCCWFGPIRGVNGPRRLHADRTCLGVSAQYVTEGTARPERQYVGACCEEAGSWWFIAVSVGSY